MENLEDSALFDDLVSKELGHYVYALFDPETNHPFYVGKGGGRSGRGNRRVFDHFDEARGTRKSPKLEKIREIWRRGDGTNDVPWKLLRVGMATEEEALLVESAIIDLLREMGVPLTNIQSGHGSTISGLKTPSDLRAWLAPVLNLNKLPTDLLCRPVFIFNIANGVAQNKSELPSDNPEVLRAATCKSWRVGKAFRSQSNGIALGCVNGIVRIALNIKDWKPDGDRWEIIANENASSTHRIEVLEYMNVSSIINHCLGYWQRGNYLVVRFEDNENVGILRGSGNRLMKLPGANG